LPFKKSVAILLVPQLILAAAQAQAPAAQPQTSVAQPQAPAAQPQTPAAQPPPLTPLSPAPTVEDLKVLVLEGQRSTNNSTRHIGIQPVVEVRDQNDRPIEGATVVFRLPPSGPGGTFPGNSPTFSTRTNAQGQAAASGFVPNDALGRFDIHATATLQNRTGEATISQTNSSNNLTLVQPQPPSFWRRHKYWLIGGGAAIVVAAILSVTLRGSGSKQQVTITPGQVTINQ
jgi:hypothetical protein